MTERGPLTGIGGAPNPAEPSHSGDAPAPAPAHARAPAGPPAADLAAVRRTDALIESLAARRPPVTAAAPHPAPPACAGDDPDPAVRLLHALIIDVDEQSADPAPPAPPAPSGPGPRRRGSRTIVALGVAGAVLASTGVAAAGGGADRSTGAAPAPRASEHAAPAAMPAAGDADAATRARPQEPSAAPAPVPEPTRTGRPSRGGEREDITRLKRRLDDLFPPRRHHERRPEGPVRITRAAPSDRPEAAPGDDPVLDLDDLAALRREAERRTDRYRAPRWDD